MARGPTVAELLAAGRKKARKIRKQAVRDVEAFIPPILGPAGRVAPSIANLAGIATETLINEVADRAFQDFQQTQVPITRTQSGPPILTRPPTKSGPTEDGGFFTPEQAAEWDRKVAASPSLARKRRSDAQLVNDQIQSNSLSAINKRARKKNGQLKKGWTQKKIMRLAQKECTKERERLGLCKRK